MIIERAYYSESEKKNNKLYYFLFYNDVAHWFMLVWILL